MSKATDPHLGGSCRAAGSAPTRPVIRMRILSWILPATMLLSSVTPAALQGQVRSDPPAEPAQGPPERAPRELGPGSEPDRWVEFMIVGGLLGGAAGALAGHLSGDDNADLFALDRGAKTAVMGAIGAAAGALIGVAAARWGGVRGPRPSGGATLFVRPLTDVDRGGLRFGASVPVGGR